MRMLFTQCAKEEDARARVLTGLGLFGRQSEGRPNDEYVIEDGVLREWQSLQIAWPSTADVAAQYLPAGPSPPCTPAPTMPTEVKIGGKTVVYDPAAMGPLISQQDMIDYAEECRRTTATPVPPMQRPPHGIPVLAANQPVPPAPTAPSPTPPPPAPPAPSASSTSASRSTEGLFQGKEITLPYHTTRMFATRKADLEKFYESWFRKGLRCDEYIYEMQSRYEDTAFEALDTLLERFVVR